MTKKTQELINSILSEIIDDWYKSVSSHYITEESLLENPSEEATAQLKRFHDKKGHRIKFKKYDLDTTYGLKATWNGNQLEIEVSVNNKVEQFDYKNFSKQLFSHYHDAGSLPVTKPQNLKRPKYRELFQLPGQLDDVFQVERNKDRADIMKLIFQIQEEYIDRLMARPGATRELIEKYCVAPFRSIYARVYRSTHSS